MRRRAGRARPGVVRDARGRAVTLLDPMHDWLAGRHETIPKETLEAVVREVSGHVAADRRRILAGVACFGLVFAAAAAAIAVSVVREGRGAWGDLVGSLVFTGPALAAMAVAGVWLPLEAARRSRLARVRGAMLRQGHCPHCGYGLRGVPASAEGLVVCPECSAAWRGVGAEG